MKGFVSGAAERNAEPGPVLAPVAALNSYMYLCCGRLLSAKRKFEVAKFSASKRSLRYGNLLSVNGGTHHNGKITASNYCPNHQPKVHSMRLLHWKCDSNRTYSAGLSAEWRLIVAT